MPFASTDDFVMTGGADTVGKKEEVPRDGCQGAGLGGRHRWLGAWESESDREGRPCNSGLGAARTVPLVIYPTELPGLSCSFPLWIL